MVAHQESDEPLVSRRHLLRGEIERDSRTVCHSQIRGERAVEREEALVEDVDHLSGRLDGLVYLQRLGGGSGHGRGTLRTDPDGVAPTSRALLAPAAFAARLVQLRVADDEPRLVERRR